MKSDFDNNDNNDGAVADNDGDFFCSQFCSMFEASMAKRSVQAHIFSHTIFSKQTWRSFKFMCCHVRTGMSKCDLSATGNTDRFEIGLDN